MVIYEYENHYHKWRDIMRKIVLSTLLIFTLVFNVVFAAPPAHFKGKDVKYIFPHAVTKDGLLPIEGKITATDYASILKSINNVQDNNLALRSKVASYYVELAKTTQNLFFNEDGSIVSSYDYTDNEYHNQNKTDIASIAQMSIAFYDAYVNNVKFNYGLSYKSTLNNLERYIKTAKKAERRTAKYKKAVADLARYKKIVQNAATFQKNVKDLSYKNALSTSSYVLNNLYKEGKFYNDPSLQSINYGTMGNGLLALNVQWNLSGTSDKQRLTQIAKEVYDYINASYDEEYDVFVFSGDRQNVKFDLKDFGMFLWGAKELSTILIQNGYGIEAANLMLKTTKMVNKVIVKDVTYKNEGIAREIAVVNGVVSASRDEINTGRLHQFLYGFMKWNESQFTSFIGVHSKNVMLAKNMLINSIKNHIDAFAIIHDTKFTDVTIKNDAKEIPYIAWFMVTADYFAENHKHHLSKEENDLIQRAIQKNYDFLMNKVLTLGKNM